MDIAEFLLPYPEVQVAGPKDNADILAFFSEANLGVQGMQIVYDRSPNFFKFLELHSDDFFVLIYRSNHQVQGVASYVFRDGIINGKAARMCYLADLRIGSDRKASKVWRKLYGEFLANRHKINQFKTVKCFYTCLMDDNALSEKNLVRNRKSGFAYHRVCPYSMVTLLSKKPWPVKPTHLLKRKPSALKVQSPKNLSELLKFYETHEGVVPRGYLFSQMIPQRLADWPQLSNSDFLIVKKGSEILASCALWSPTNTKKILLKNPPWTLKPVLRFQEELRVLYLTHVVFKKDLSLQEKQDVFRKLLKKAWELRSKKRAQFISFCDFHEYSLLKAASDFFTNSKSMAIYEVTAATDPAPATYSTYGFEMALV